MSTVGSGIYTYEMVENWGALPAGWTFGPVSAVAVDSRDRVYAFQRKDPPAQIPLLGACFVDCGAQPPAGPRQSGALAPHSTTLARSAEYQAESPKFWSAPRQRRFPAAGALQTFAALRETDLVC